ncbi:hypothetical protein DQ04_12701010 [Trypanosoma grayi]|uniref:hypothetical protein n=1 Tax=Trypanosoma grayi TaxID=71804 RepID=UPI0004F46136|nr:hypothetical protein DQ04_12701010 [Trypanosoma grayi]KEG06698.1 hypothetical protein DQ04_12701010 [Trypanosoma grayi]
MTGRLMLSRIMKTSNSTPIVRTQALARPLIAPWSTAPTEGPAAGTRVKRVGSMRGDQNFPAQVSSKERRTQLATWQCPKKKPRHINEPPMSYSISCTHATQSWLLSETHDTR